jgi:hypothetical protein
VGGVSRIDHAVNIVVKTGGWCHNFPCLSGVFVLP